MRTYAHRSVAAAALVAAALLAGPGAAGDKDKVWKPFLSKDAYQELIGRAARNIEDALAGKPGEEALKRAQFNAVMLAAYTLSTSATGDEARAGLRESALKLAKLIPQKGKLAAARAQAAMLLKGKVNPAAKGAVGDWKAYLEERAELMEHFKTKMKGGEGIPPALQSNIRLKGTQNGIEEKVRALAAKEMSPAAMKKEADELALLGYRAAVLAEVTYHYLPKKNASEWKELALAMRDAGIALAEAAKKKDTEAAFKASNSLNSSCNQCHSAFRGKIN